MNDAHLHLVVNHFPIIGTIFGLGILIVGLLLKNKSVLNTAYSLFIIAAIFAAFSMATGEGAEETVENLPGVTENFIETHEEYAEKLAVVLYILGGISIAGIALNFKNYAKSNLVTYAALVVALIGVFLAKEVGTSGGEVRHTEIRANAALTAGEGAENKATGEKGEEEDND